VVCVDENLDDKCSDSENPVLTDPLGYAYDVKRAQGSLAPLLAIANALTVDADTGPVYQPYKMSAPAGKVVITPATTMVQVYKSAFGGSTERAEAAVKALITGNKFDIDPYQDYVIAENDANKIMRNFSRMTVALIQSLSKETEGAADPDATDEAVKRRVLELLPKITSAALSPEVAGQTDNKSRDEALQARVLTLALEANLTFTNVVDAIAFYKAGPAEPDTVILASLSYASPENYTVRTLLQTPAQAIPDQDGKTYFRDGGKRQNGSALVDEWGIDFHRNATYWTGSAWFACPDDHLHEISGPNENRSVLYCNADRYSEGFLKFKNGASPIVGAGKLFEPKKIDDQLDPIVIPPGAINSAATFPAENKQYVLTRFNENPADRFNPVESPRMLSGGQTSSGSVWWSILWISC
jgi:hypothetical protein